MRNDAEAVDILIEALGMSWRVWRRLCGGADILPVEAGINVTEM